MKIPLKCLLGLHKKSYYFGSDAIACASCGKILREATMTTCFRDGKFVPATKRKKENKP